MRLALRVRPGARRSEWLGPQGDRLKVAVRAPPVDGKANKELLRWLAKALGVSRSDLELVAGTSSRDKTVAVAASRDEVRAAVRAAHGRPPHGDGESCCP